jgi:hypothetical protein
MTGGKERTTTRIPDANVREMRERGDIGCGVGREEVEEKEEMRGEKMFGGAGRTDNGVWWAVAAKRSRMHAREVQLWATQRAVGDGSDVRPAERRKWKGAMTKRHWGSSLDDG